MKKLFFVLAIIVGLSAAANAQKSTNSEMKKTQTVELKDHVCTDACHTSGHCVYAHGEKGHVCTAACKTMTSASATSATSATPAELKDHVCTANCTNGNHVYAHGEKGHVCTAECMKKK